MARTFRRKNQVPDFVVRESIRIDGSCAGYRYFTGKELRAAVAHWQSDRARPYPCNHSKYFRHVHENVYRTLCRRELHKFMKCKEHEVRIPRRIPYDYWD